MKKLLKKFLGETGIVILSWHRFKALVATIIYSFPARSLTVIGITGTDGKTTTVAMTAHILNAVGKKTGALSTAFFQVGNDIRWNPTQKTSPSPFIIQKLLRELVQAGCTHAVIECSSHGLLQGRVNYTWPVVGAITNISEEHLDYHKTMDAYMDAKGLLFKMLRKNSGVKVLNRDDRSYERMRSIPSKSTIHCSAKGNSIDINPKRDSYLLLKNPKVETGSITGEIYDTKSAKSHTLQIPMFGEYNLQNALIAIACTYSLGVSLESSVRSLQSFRGVSGRMESINEGQNFSVFLDFTVTPQAYETTLHTLKKSLRDGKKLLVLTGSCGDRMKEKRPIVGSICEKYADIVVVTNEDPYTEDPEKIIDDVVRGISTSVPIYKTAQEFQKPQNQKACIRISDRREAIKFILRQAEAGDTVLFCGKGADITMMTAKGQIPWVEREIVSEELRGMMSPRENRI